MIYFVIVRGSKFYMSRATSDRPSWHPFIMGNLRLLTRAIINWWNKGFLTMRLDKAHSTNFPCGNDLQSCFLLRKFGRTLTHTNHPHYIEKISYDLHDETLRTTLVYIALISNRISMPLQPVSKQHNRIKMGKDILCTIQVKLIVDWTNNHIVLFNSDSFNWAHTPLWTQIITTTPRPRLKLSRTISDMIGFRRAALNSVPLNWRL